MEKHMLYYKLYDEMTNDCCPICSLLQKSTDHMLEGFLYECVNDVNLRKKITESRGFCFYHSNLLMEKGDPLAHALIYKDLLKTAVHDISRDNFSRYADRSDCIFCKHLRDAEIAYTDEFVKAFMEEEFREQYKKGGMICMKHLIMTADRDEDIYQEIKSATTEKYDALVSMLDEIIIKNDYRFSDEKYSPGVKDAWRRAVNVMNSQCEIKYGK